MGRAPGRGRLLGGGKGREPERAVHDAVAEASAEVAAGVAAGGEVGNVGLGGHILVPHARTERDLARCRLVRQKAHGGVGGGAAAEDAESALVVDEVDRVGVA